MYHNLWRNGAMSVVLMAVVDGGRRFETHGGVGIFRIIFGIQLESACLAVSSLLNTDVTDYFLLEYVIYHLIFFCNWLVLTSKEGGSLQAVI